MPRNAFGRIIGVWRCQGRRIRRLLGVGHPAAFGNWLEDRLRMVDMATSETCGAFARGYGIRRSEGVGYHIAAVIGWLLCGFYRSGAGLRTLEPCMDKGIC